MTNGGNASGIAGGRAERVRNPDGSARRGRRKVCGRSNASSPSAFAEAIFGGRTILLIVLEKIFFDSWFFGTSLFQGRPRPPRHATLCARTPRDGEHQVDDILWDAAVQCKTKVRLERAFTTTTRSLDLDLASVGCPRGGSRVFSFCIFADVGSHATQADPSPLFPPPLSFASDRVHARSEVRGCPDGGLAPRRLSVAHFSTTARTSTIRAR